MTQLKDNRLFLLDLLQITAITLSSWPQLEMDTPYPFLQPSYDYSTSLAVCILLILQRDVEHLEQVRGKVFQENVCPTFYVGDGDLNSDPHV